MVAGVPVGRGDSAVASVRWAVEGRSGAEGVYRLSNGPGGRVLETGRLADTGAGPVVAECVEGFPAGGLRGAPEAAAMAAAAEAGAAVAAEKARLPAARMTTETVSAVVDEVKPRSEAAAAAHTAREGVERKRDWIQEAQSTWRRVFSVSLGAHSLS